LHGSYFHHHLITRLEKIWPLRFSHQILSVKEKDRLLSKPWD